MRPSERMRLQLGGELEEKEEQPPPEEPHEESVPERLARLEREQMEARKRDAALRSGRPRGRVILAETRGQGRPRYKRMPRCKRK